MKDHSFSKRIAVDDRTEPKAMYQDLARCRDLEQEHARLVNAMHEGYALGGLILDDLRKPRDYRFLEVNPAFGQMTGLSPQAILGRTLHELLPASAPRWIASAGEIASSGGQTCFEDQLDGSDKRFLVSAYSPGPGRLVYLLAAVTTREGQERLGPQAPEPDLSDVYGKILENIVDGVWMADADDVIFYANRGMAVIAGIPAEQMKGANVLSRFAEETLAHFRPYYLQAKAGMAPVRYQAVPVVTPRGRLTFQSGWLIPLRKAGVLEGVICTVEDITERMEAQQALRESEQRLRLIADNLPVLISYTDSELRYRFNNALYEKWFGISAQQLYGKRFEDIIGAEAFANIADYYRRAQAGETVRYLARFPYQGGGEREVEVLLLPHRDESGKVLGLYILGEDVAELLEHKRAAEALRASDTRYRNLFDNMTDGYGLAELVFDENGVPGDFRILDVNPSFERILGLPRKTLIGQTVRKVMPALESYWLDMFRRSALMCLPEHLEQYARPFERYFEVNTSCPQRGLVAVFLRDVSDRRHSEDALRSNERLLRLALDHFPGLIAVYDAERRFQYVNAFVREATGLGLEEYLGRRDEEIRAPETMRSYLPLLLRAYETGEVQRQDAWVRLPGGDYAFSLAYVPVVDEHNRLQQVLGIGLDITTSKRAEEELRRAYGRLEETVAELRRSQQEVVDAEKRAALSTMTAGIAHELNNPMMGVMNYVSYARERVDDPTLCRVLDSASRELVRMRDLLKGMLSVMRPFDEPSRWVEVQVVIDEVLELLAAEFTARQICVEKHLAPDASHMLVKEAQLQQVLMNVLTNARNALQDAAVKRIDIDVSRIAKELRIDVRDTGHGIPIENQDRIFDPFFTTNVPGEGTGLGLTIARKTLTEMGGKILVESVPGQGARFRLILPTEQGGGGA